MSDAGKLSQISVVMLGARDLPKSVAFYRDTLGLTVQSENREFAFLSGGGVTLALTGLLARNSDAAGEAVEIVFGVPGVREAYQALRAKGLQFTQEPRNVTGAMWAANFNDPDGHRLSIFGPEHQA